MVSQSKCTRSESRNFTKIYFFNDFPQISTVKDFNFQLFGFLRKSTLRFDGSPLLYLIFYSNLSGCGVSIKLQLTQNGYNQVYIQCIKRVHCTQVFYDMTWFVPYLCSLTFNVRSELDQMSDVSNQSLCRKMVGKSPKYKRTAMSS